MTTTHERPPSRKSLFFSLLFAVGVPAALAIFYCVGFGMQVAGWYLVERNGGNSGPFPTFLDFGHQSILLVTTVISGMIALLLVANAARSEAESNG